MKSFKMLGAILGLALGCAFPSAAQDRPAHDRSFQDRGQWSAANSTARAITGDISISDSKLTISLLSFPLAPIRKLEAAEVSAVFVAEGSRGQGGNLYRLSIAAAQRFVHKNSLCGSEVTEWMVTNVSGKSLQVAFFSGANMPVFTPEAMNNSTDLCGTFAYVR